MSRWDRIVSAEIRVSERFRHATDIFALVHAILFVPVFLGTTHFILLGPGLGDDLTFSHLTSFFQDATAAGPIPLLLLAGLLCLSTGYRGLIFYRGYKEYGNWAGQALPIKDYLVFTAMNLMNAFFLPVMSLVIGAMAIGFGFSFADGLQAVTRVQVAANQAIDQVPTIFHLPRLEAFFATFMAVTFVHYWMHRISHTRRFMWLVFHRPHHMPENLCPGTVLPFVMSFPLAIFILAPYIFLFGAISKLFYPEPFYYEMIVFTLIFGISEIHNHSPALYEKAVKTWWLRWLSFAFCNGPYHVLHHAADRDERFRKSAWTANISLSFFCIWDILFGTFRPLGEKLPELGLTDKPRLVYNPVRLLVSGPAQILYELYWNKSRHDRFLIVFGRADYYPPITKDFALYRDLGVHPPKDRALVAVGSGNLSS